MEQLLEEESNKWVTKELRDSSISCKFFDTDTVAKLWVYQAP